MRWDVIDLQISGNCEKYIIKLENDMAIEVGAIMHNDLLHLCMPSQVGCSIHCYHCATTYSKNSYLGNINYEDLSSLTEYFINKYSMKKTVLSFSGHGEPLLNWDNVLNVASNNQNKVEKIFVTTVGIKSVLNEIQHLANKFITFYFSIHGTSDQKRSLLIPERNKKIANLLDIINFTNQYTSNNGKVIWNYMLHTGNCTSQDANDFIKILKMLKNNVEVRITSYMDIDSELNTHSKIKTATKEDTNQFMHILLRNNYLIPHISFRTSYIEGTNIKVACGQMRAHFLANNGDL